jgi:hypothetical protein
MVVERRAHRSERLLEPAPARAEAHHLAEHVEQRLRVVDQAPAARLRHVDHEPIGELRLAELQRAALAGRRAAAVADLPGRRSRRRAPARLRPHVRRDDPEMQVREPTRRPGELIEEHLEAVGQVDLQLEHPGRIVDDEQQIEIARRRRRQLEHRLPRVGGWLVTAVAGTRDHHHHRHRNASRQGPHRG